MMSTKAHKGVAVQRYFLILTFCLPLAACVSPGVISYDAQRIHGTATSDSQKASATKAYLELPLPFEPIAEIRQDLERREGLTLKNRGEAHITVITPPEFKKIQPLLTMNTIEQIASEFKIQETPLKLICIGKGHLKDQPELGSTFFLVVEADRLFAIRHKIAQEFRAKGGLDRDFNPELFYPHVTLGFTQRDLHYEDGVLKDESSCLYKLKKRTP